jgi:hypothetical protein
VTLHLYAVAEHGVELPPVDGIDGASLRRVHVDDLDAIVSDVDGATSPTEAAVLTHAAVVDAVAAAADAVLPARFGSGFEQEGAVATEVGARRDELLRALERVRGCVELGVRALVGDVAAPEDTGATDSGRRYMLARLERVRAGDRLSADLDAALGPVARAASSSVVGSEPLVVTGAYLVARGDIDAFQARVDEFQRERPELTLICTGPWPPYSFATVDAARA